MDFTDKNSYQNPREIAVLSVSRFEDDNHLSSRQTYQFTTPPSQIGNLQRSIVSGRTKGGCHDFLIALFVVLGLCLILGIVVPTLRLTSKLNDPNSQAFSSPPSDEVFPSGGTDPVTLDDILVGRLSAVMFNGSWHDNKTILFYDRFFNLILFQADTLTKKVIISNESMFAHNLNGNLLSRDKKFLLCAYDSKKAFRHSKLAKYKIYDIDKNETKELIPDPTNRNERNIQYAEWGPNGNQLFFIYKNNIYYMTNHSSEPIPLTTTGKPKVIFNGIADWVYEEEILSDEKAFWVNSDGSHLIYAQFNDTEVEEASWPVYGDPLNLTDPYTKTVSVRYPKPGKKNPDVNLFVHNLNSSEIWEVKPQDNYILNSDYYLTSVNWLNSEQIIIIWLNRQQNFSTIDICSTVNRTCFTSVTLGSTKGWVSFEATIAAHDLNSYFIRIPKLDDESKSYYEHVAMVNIHNFNVTYLTTGQFDVIQIMSYDKLNNKVYFASSIKDHPEQRHINSVTIPSDFNNKTTIECLTCNVSTSCHYTSALFSPDSLFYILNCQGPNVPFVQLRRTHDNNVSLIWEKNQSLRRTLEQKLLPTIKRFKVKTTNEYYANVELVLPPNFTDTNKYPVLFDVYAGPNSQSVKENYKFNHWSTFITGNQSIIYARVDGRGSANQGLKYLHEIYENFGKVEIEDIITVARYLRDKISYVKSDSIAIWGWSYGGYATLLSLINDHNDVVFHCGISVAPVTNWLLYDSVYVERYLGLPASNQLAYNQSNVLSKVYFLKNKKLLLVFGTADDNVHAQHSMFLIRQLNEFGIFYDTQIYPDNDHSLAGDIQHLYNRMNLFIKECFEQEKK